MTDKMLNWPASYTRLGDEVVRRKAVVMPSVHHTGTWFTAGFLTEHPNLGAAVALQDVLARNTLGGHDVVHFHVGGAPKLWDAYSALRGTGRMVVPLRDPMLCLCTRQARHPFLDHSYIVDGFCRIAEQHDGVTFLPVDQPAAGREAVLKRVLAALDLDLGDDYVNFWARGWAARNSIGYDTAEKSWYRDRKWSALRNAMSPEVDRLLESRPLLIPFLQARGYKELPWWTV